MRRRSAGTQRARRLIAVAHLAARRRDQRGEHADERRLARAVRAEQADDVAGARGQRDARHRPAAAEMSRDVDELTRGRSRQRHAQATTGAVGGLGARVVAVERAVDLLERRDESPRGAPHSARSSPRPLRCSCSSRTSSLNSFSRRAISRFRSAALPDASPLGRPANQTPMSDDDAGQRQRDRCAAPRLWCGRPRPSSCSGCPAGNRAAGRGDERPRPPRACSCCSLELRRDDSVVSPTFFTMTASCSSGAGKRCAIVERSGRRRQRQADLHEGVPRRKRTLHADVRPSTLACGDEPSMIVAPTRAGRHVELERRRRIHRHARVVRDVEQVVDLRPPLRPAR